MRSGAALTCTALQNRRGTGARSWLDGSSRHSPCKHHHPDSLTRSDVIRITRMFDEFIHITYVSVSSCQDLHDLQYYRTLHAYVHVCPWINLYCTSRCMLSYWFKWKPVVTCSEWWRRLDQNRILYRSWDWQNLLAPWTKQVKFCTLVVHKIRENSSTHWDRDGSLQHLS